MYTVITQFQGYLLSMKRGYNFSATFFKTVGIYIILYI